MMDRTQEKEQQLEVQRNEDKRKHDKLGGLKADREHKLNILKKKIAEETWLLNELEKESKVTVTKQKGKQAAQAGKKGEKKKEEAEEPNYDSMLQTLRGPICEIYNILPDTGAVEAMSSKDLIQKVEIKMEEYMRDIRYIHDGEQANAMEIKTLVQEVHEKKKKRVKEELEEKRLKEQAEKQAAAQKLKIKTREFGKPKMVRSEKPKIKQKIIKIEENEKTKDEKYYLGFALDELEQEALTGN